jgi:hypothetical protein
MAVRKLDLVAVRHHAAKVLAFWALTNFLLRLVQARHQGQCATERTVVTLRIPLIPPYDLSVKSQQATSRGSDLRGLDRVLNCSMAPRRMIAASCYPAENSMPYAMYEVLFQLPQPCHELLANFPSLR